MVLQEKSMTSFSHRLGFPVDQVLYIFALLMSFFIAVVYNLFLPPQKTSKNVRLLIGFIGGLWVTWFCFSSSGLVQILFLPTTCYVIINIASPRYVQRYTFILSMGWLSLNHIYRQVTDYGGYTLDITGPLMLMTQRVIYVAYALHDGLGRITSEVTEEQKLHSIKRKPSFLEYFAYLLNFHSVLAGPVCTYHEYIEFIEGTDVEKYRNNKDFKKFPAKTILRKSGVVLAFLLFYCLTKEYFPAQKCTDPTFIATTPLFVKIIFSYIAISSTRSRYYFGWGFADLINNAAGMGFDGFDNNGQPLWDKYMSCDVMKTELATSIRMLTLNWNIPTVKWLRRIVYERTENHAVLATFIVSAFWHGFYPGYYLFFFTVGSLTLSSRMTRRAFRAFFQETESRQIFYEFLTGFVTMLLVSYIGQAFLLLHFESTLAHWKSMYFYGHILIICGFASPRLSRLLGMNRDNVKKDKNSNTTHQQNNFIVQNHEKTD